MTSQHGWFRHHLWTIEGILNGRWPYWIAILLNGTIGKLPAWAIPQLDFSSHADGVQPGCRNLAALGGSITGLKLRRQAGGAAEAKAHAIKTFQKALDNGSNHLQQLVDWWLFAFGSGRVKERPRLSERGALTMYCDLQLQRLIANPADWGSWISLEILGGSKSGTAWFPTPMSISHLMTRMTFEMNGEQDTRLLSVHDPCVGTGVFLLDASNYSLDLCCQDIDPLMCAWTEFAGWLFIPWLVWGDKRQIREFAARDLRERVDRMKALLAGPPAAPAEEPVGTAG